MKQCQAWETAGARVFTRPLRYLPDWRQRGADQKGVDVALAIDFISLAIDEEYDVGIIASTDADLHPALEFVYQRLYPDRRGEVANWSAGLGPGKSRRKLRLADHNIWCHWLTKADYDQVADLTDYTVP